jgi:hypothetical protein
MQNVNVTSKGEKGPVPARISLLFARESPTAVIFRRGPSKWVQIIKWNTDTDEFSPGQWFHGRIYDRRSDLSPDGSLMVYFAQKITGRTLGDSDYTYAWTAISRPPFLTALALWPKGDCWHGGGSFVDDKTVLLNHKKDVSKPHPNHKPVGLKVVLKKDVCGEDDPVYSDRLERDGWKRIQEWKVDLTGFERGYVTSQPEIRLKAAPEGYRFVRLVRSITGFNYSEEFTVLDRQDGIEVTIERASWVDWDRAGRLLVARDGRISIAKIGPKGQFIDHELANFNSSRPTSVAPPKWAASW